MCGIFGYIGKRNVVKACTEGLSLLEYRGYDSAGIAGVVEGKIALRKRAGKVADLCEVLDLVHLDFAIAHTRWATHGVVNECNAHPHLDSSESFALIHNGIIENYATLKQEMQERGVSFLSETDTEVLVQLIAAEYCGDLAAAVDRVAKRLKGVFSFLVIHKDHQEIVGFANGCPLSVGVNEDEVILSSDPNTFLGQSFRVLFLDPQETVRVRRGSVEIFDPGMKQKEKRTLVMESILKPPSKGSFPHFMLKEIYEQPEACKRALEGRLGSNGVFFQNLLLSEESLRDSDVVWTVGSGTSFLAGMVGGLFLEEWASLPSLCEIASEAQYRTTFFSSKTMMVAISQSGETADTLAALRKAKCDGYKTLALCNTEHSAMAREADGVLFLKAGPEVSVCSTKAFTSQLILLALFSLHMSALRKRLGEEEILLLGKSLEQLPQMMQTVLDRVDQIAALAKKYARYDDFFFMGRRYMYPTALEAALKLKEISYVNANGYPAGELKHGPIALLDRNFPVIAFCANEKTREKMISNLMEVKARGAPLLAIAPERMKEVEKIADDILWIPDSSDPLAPFPSIVAGQLFAYEIAKARGCPIDQPRNLAKSVTVE
ncbi:MAG: glutamine--fructose-6-phosphate transaminase (isomerizing) [Verrucomicrobiota bacterium]|nr:glutamine--fructose-6-phosphate transaminase (isomerizing) [Verrucomicrobiota bacterium]